MRPFIWMNVALLLVLCCWSGGVRGIYEDEAGRIDWTIENVGQVHSLSFSDPSETKKIYLGTHSNIVAAVNYLTGGIAWRQLLPNQHRLDGLVHKGKRIMSISNKGEHIALWRATDGAAIWDAKNELSTSCSEAQSEGVLLNSDIDEDGIFDVAFLLSGTVQLRSGANGDIISSIPVDCHTSALLIAEIAHQRPRIYALGLDQSALTVKSITIEGKIAHQQSYKSESDILSFITVGPYSIALDQSNNIHQLSFNSMSLPSSFSSFSLSSKLSTRHAIDPRYVSLEQTRSSSSFFVRINERETAAFAIDGSAIKLLHVFSHQHDRVCATSGFGSKEALAVVSVGKTADIEYFIVSQRTSEKITIPEINVASNGEAVAAFIEIVPTKTLDGFVKLTAIVTKDHALSFVRDNSLVWTREEGLASLSHVEIIDPPGDIAEQALLEKEFHEIDHLSVVQQFLQQVQGQSIALLSSVPKDFSSLIAWINTQLHQSDEDESSLTKDRFGVKKLIISYSADAGTVFGLHSSKGSLIWKRFISTSLYRIEGLHFLRSAAHYPPEAVLILSSPDSTTTVMWINALTGETMTSSKLNVKHLQSFTLPHYVNNEKLLLLIDSDHKAHVIPEIREARQALRLHQNEIFFYQITSSSIDGFGFDSELQPQKRWSFVIPDGASFYHAQKNKHEIVQSPIKSLGSEGVTAKYINKNTMACAIVSPSSSLESRVLDVYILDTVTGDVVYHAIHRGARGPVNMVISENWMVYHFFNQKANRYQMSVVELYEKELNWNATTFSSFSHVRPVAYSQAYFFNSDVTAIGVTVTARGITSKQILIATEAGQILGIDKNVLDARRVVADKMSPVDKEEGMIPYDANIVVGPKNYHSYNKTVNNVKKIEVGWARLESTGIVIAIGSPNIFFSRVLPSDSFDLLPPTFNFGMLIFTCALLVVLTMVAAWFSKSKDLKQQWK